MKAVIKKSFSLAVVVLGLCAGSAQAQELTVKIPFPFLAQGRTLPAGTYVVSRADQDPTAMVLRGEDANRKAFAIVLTRPADGHDPAGDKPALIFSRFENQYRLSAIWESASEGQQMISKKS